MGMVAYLIAKAKSMEEDTDHHEFPDLSIPHWKDFLITKCCNPTWLDTFSISEACTFAAGTRTELFINPLTIR